MDTTGELRLGPLQKMLDDCAKTIGSHRIERVDEQGHNAQPVDPALVKEAVEAMSALSRKLGLLCREGVLAVRIK